MSIEQMSTSIMLLVLLGIAVVSDLRCHRIPNLLIVVGLALGLISQAYASGVDGLGNAALATLIGFAVLLPMYALGGMAAGDVKLMAMVGSFLTPFSALWAVFQFDGRCAVRCADCPVSRPTKANLGALLADSKCTSLLGTGGKRSSRQAVPLLRGNFARNSGQWLLALYRSVA